MKLTGHAEEWFPEALGPAGSIRDFGFGIWDLGFGIYETRQSSRHIESARFFATSSASKVPVFKQYPRSVKLVLDSPKPPPIRLQALSRTSVDSSIQYPKSNIQILDWGFTRRANHRAKLNPRVFRHAQRI